MCFGESTNVVRADSAGFFKVKFEQDMTEPRILWADLKGYRLSTRGAIYQKDAGPDGFLYVEMVNLVPPQSNSPPDGAGGISEREFMMLSRLRFDCNGNGVFDDLEIASGALPDSNHNGIPDGCESQVKR
jgi:hypothetical protein